MPLPPESIDEQQLLQRIAAADERAFYVLHNRYYNRIIKFLINITWSNPEDLCDIMQEVFLSIWERKYLLPHIANFEGYACIMAKNILLNAERGREVRKKALSEYAAGLPERHVLSDNNAVYKCMQKEAWKILQAIPGTRGQVIRLHVEYALSLSQIARQLNISPQMASRHVLKAKELIYRQLAQYGHWIFLPLALMAGVLPEESAVLMQVYSANWKLFFEAWGL